MNTPENTTTNIGGKPVSPEKEGPQSGNPPRGAQGGDGSGPADVPEPAAPSPNAAASQDQTAKLQAEVDRLRDQSLRDRADFENTRKRLQREKEEGIQYANTRLLEKLLPVLDNFELGMMEARKAGEGSAVVNGMSMVQRQLEDFLRDNGVQIIDAVGQKFDPNQHEALGELPNPEVPEGHVVQQTRKGYKLRERLLRAANVFISKGKG